MIPYVQISTIPFGPLTLHVWGLFAAIGFLSATIVAAQRARRQGLNGEIVWQAGWWIVVAGMAGARLFEVMFYDPRYYWAHPEKILAFWDGGLSSTGGIIAGGLVVWWFLKRNKLPFLPWADVFAFAAPLGLLFGRIGCFFINDHPGRLTNFFLGVRYPDGIRHDGGLEMAIADGLIFLIMLVVGRRHSPSPRRGEGWGEGRKAFPPGSFVLLFLGLKGFARFWLDFYRATDIAIPEVRYLGLTPSQYAGLFAVLLVATLLIFSFQRIIPPKESYRRT